jgi:hypothetical protein
MPALDILADMQDKPFESVLAHELSGYWESDQLLLALSILEREPVDVYDENL